MDLGILFILFISCLIGLSYGIVFLVKGKANKPFRPIDIFLVFLFCFSWIVFLIALSWYSFNYNVAIDPVDDGYSPFSQNHQFSFLLFFGLSLLGIFKIWKWGRKQPPLLLVIYLSFLIIGIVINVFLAIQLSSRHDGTYYIKSTEGKFLMIAPIIHILVSLIFIIKLILEESINANERKFKNKLLNKLNQFILKSKMLPLWVLIALLPVYFFFTLILILFGQDYDSLTKVFTDTTTWHFSQQTHPPYLDHSGHYLCTVAACGTPEVVRPMRLGIRNGKEIIVNRQLLIANAFEDIIMKSTPRLHKLIRRNYDKYGYPLSKDINTKLKSNLTYILMKPLEWLFLIFIYLTKENPEKLINEQYKMDGTEMY